MASTPKPTHAAPEAKAKIYDPPPAKPNAPEPPKYADGPTIAELQRASSAKLEQDGMAKYIDEIDERDPDDKPKQVPGVTPPTKRS